MSGQLESTCDNRKSLTGLVNMGNTCYMNAVLQCLRQIDCLNIYISSDKAMEIISKNRIQMSIDQPIETLENYVSLLLSYSKLVNDLWINVGGCLRPQVFRSFLRKINDFEMFANSQHHDAYEFMMKILDIYHLILSRNVKYKINENVTNESDKYLLESYKQWSEYHKNRHSIILDIFYFQQLTKIKCLNPVCTREASKYDSSMGFQLPIDNVLSGAQLYQCFDNYCQMEELSDNNLLYCETCLTKQKAQIMKYIWTLPNILIICLGRFKYQLTMYGYQLNKMGTYIDFPISNLDLSKYVHPLSNTDRLKYNLFATINHIGDLNAGHYYAQSYSDLHNKWYRYDDVNVSEINLDKVVNSDAYILFYKKSS